MDAVRDSRDAYRHFLALAVVVDVQMTQCGVSAVLVVGVAQAALAIQLAVGVPGLVVVRANHAARVVLLGAVRDADA